MLGSFYYLCICVSITEMQCLMNNTGKLHLQAWVESLDIDDALLQENVSLFNESFAVQVEVLSGVCDHRWAGIPTTVHGSDACKRVAFFDALVALPPLLSFHVPLMLELRDDVQISRTLQ